MKRLKADVHTAGIAEKLKALLVIAAFRMFNRYVDGLDTGQPRNEELYREEEGRRRGRGTWR